ncbi:nicotinate-nucleotide adenylyltransferase [Novosphingobium sp.]|uniref:nicotinate-nucleotide adenylyltransferase n=1 Tax=Novosphingobium sp. TaxID=1874826 RepID=UPI003B52F1C8
MAGARHWPDQAVILTGTRTIGLLGGSFNPAHGAHRRISLHAIKALGLDEVWWLVSPGNVLKPADGMAGLPARYASAQRVARGAPIRVTAIEAEMGTRYTADTLAKLVLRYPRFRFIWLMGADNLAQFHRWRNWRGIARLMPIAVIARPGYDARAMASPAMVWLRRWRRRHGQGCLAKDGSGARRSNPALYTLHFDPDPMSATAIRAADPDWHRRIPAALLRDMLTKHPVRLPNLGAKS